MNEEGWRIRDEGWRMKDEGWWFQAVEGFCDWLTDRRTNICECRVAFATENGLPGVTDKARMADSENDKK